MANRRDHSTAGVAVGGMAAFFLARDHGRHLVEALGGAIGGVVGGRLPDILLHAGTPMGLRL